MGFPFPLGIPFPWSSLAYSVVQCAGVLVAAKQRQEFRISLQKRARHRAEKRAEWLETEVNWREVSELTLID